MLKRNKTSEKIDKKVQRAADFELTVADMARRSEKRAWRVASASLLMSFALAGGLFYVIPHMEKREPYLVMADARTGTASLVRLHQGADYSRITASQAVNLSNVSQYIIARESYDGGRISDRDRRVVYTMSSAPVRKGYEVERGRRDPESLYGRYRDRYAIRVRINSITMADAMPGKPPAGAVVRFQRVLYEVATGISQVLDNKIATIDFNYNPEIRFSRPEDGVVNPLRFQVTNYRIDEDRSLPTPEVPSVAAPAPVAAAAPEIDAAALQEDAAAPMPGAETPPSPRQPQGQQP